MNITAGLNLPDKTRIARSFGNAAASYDRFAHFQRDISDRLLSCLEMNSPENILDLGSGTGYCAEKITRLYPGATVTSLDIAKAMLDQDRARRPSGYQVCGDAEGLPFADGSFDLVVSNLTLQWCGNPEKYFHELFRIMKPGAHAHISTLAENTLAELKESWAVLDTSVHVNNFMSCEDVIHCLEVEAFSMQDLVHRQHQVFYESLSALKDELKGIGAHNVNAGRDIGLTGKSKVKKLRESFEKRKIHGKGIPVTYDLVLLHLVKRA